MGGSVAQVLHQGAARHPEQVAVVALDAAGGRKASHSYWRMDDRACRIASGLIAAGVMPGDHVALCAENSMEFVAAYFGILYAGAAVVPIAILSAAPEVRLRVEHARCKVIIFDADRAPLARNMGIAKAMSLERLSQDPRTLARPRNRSAEDTAMVLYTSGTMGRAKGAVISHGALLTHTAVLAYHALRFQPNDRILGVLPLTHSYGCRMVMLSSLYAGAACVLLPRFSAAVCLDVMTREDITWLPGVPTMFTAFGQLPQSTHKLHLRWAMCAGAPLPEEAARQAEARLDCEVRQGYGMTEATIATLNAPPDARVAACVGKPVWGVELRIVDDSGCDMPAGSSGEVWLRGHNTMSRYLDDPSATAAVQREGFMRSGDVGYIDSEGRLFIIDRIKDLIIRGGNNVYPSEVETALVEHPAIAAVAVVGRPDDYYGEEVVAVIIKRPDASLTAEEVASWATERVAKTKVPREVAFVDEFPLGPSGKVLKRELRQSIIEGKLATQRCG